MMNETDQNSISKNNKKDKTGIFISLVLIILLVPIIIFNICGYVLGWKWVGVFNIQSGEQKTLWDWMELLVIPAALAITAYLLNRSDKVSDRNLSEKQRANERNVADQRAKIAQKIARDSQRQTTLETYFDRITELLFMRNLRKAVPGDEVRIIARTHTLTVLRELDGKRKGRVIRFLHELELINGKEPIIDMSYADLDDIDLPYSKLENISLPFVTLRNGNLEYSHLDGANFNTATLHGTTFMGANLNNADLRCGLYRANLSAANLVKAVMCGAYMGGANLMHAKMIGADLRKANLKYAHRLHIEIDKGELEFANLNQADLSDSDLSDAMIDISQLQSVWSLKGARMPNGQKYEEWEEDQKKSDG